jgi:antitoxin component of MazEF toxin-antitoxin module
MRARISRWGSGLGVRLPKAIAEAAGLKEGDLVDLVIRPGGVDLVRADALQRSLDELVAEMKSLGPVLRPTFEDWGILPSEWPAEDWSDIAPPHKA